MVSASPPRWRGPRRTCGSRASTAGDVVPRVARGREPDAPRTTTLALTLSDGYCLFSDPNPLPTPDHCTTGTLSGSAGWGIRCRKGKARPDGALVREFAGVHGGLRAHQRRAGDRGVFPSRAPVARPAGARLRTRSGPRDGDLFIKEGEPGR
jgi:hypothetical protein